MRSYRRHTLLPLLLLLLGLLVGGSLAQPPAQPPQFQSASGEPQRTVVMRLDPPRNMAVQQRAEPPRAVPQGQALHVPTVVEQPAQNSRRVPSPPPQAQQQQQPQQIQQQPQQVNYGPQPAIYPAEGFAPTVRVPFSAGGQPQPQPQQQAQLQQRPLFSVGGGMPPTASGAGVPRVQIPQGLAGFGGIDATQQPPAPVRVQQPVIPSTLPGGPAKSEQAFTARTEGNPPPPPPLNIPTDVQNQLIKFFGLDSFGIPGLTGNHPNGFAGAVQEMRNAGIPVQLLPAEHVAGQPVQAPQSDVLVQANPSFANELNNIMHEARAPFTPSAGAPNLPLPDPKPGENGLIGLLSTSIRKLVKDTGMADAISQSLPSVLGGSSSSSGSSGSSSSGSGSSSPIVAADAPRSSPSSSSGVASKGDGIRRQQSAAERALAGFASALGGSGPNGPSHAGLPRIPGIPLLPGGIPRNAQGQIDVVQLIGSITRRVSNGTTLADIIPPEQLQTLADNVTDALLPSTPEEFDLTKFMGRWFEGINSPRATEQRCVVHHYGGLTKNDRTATFTALKIYREGSEFGPVRYSIGYAFRAGNKEAMLQLHSSENSDAQPFWVYKLGPEGSDPFGNKQYEYAIVSNWVKYPVIVLVRDPDSFKQKYEVEVLRWLEDQGFINGFVRAFNLLQPASYSSCQYAENTFELFGKKR